MSVDLVSVHYHPAHLAQSLRIAAEMFSRAGARRWIAVLNNPELDPAAVVAAGAEAVPHDNRGLEFGAWQAGLDRLGAASDRVLFLNDSAGLHRAFPSLHRENLARFCKAPLTPGVPAAAGEEERMPRAYRLLGKHTSRWLTTSAFALNRPALELLGQRVYCEELEELVSTRSIEEFFSPTLDRVLVSHISQWLFEPRSPVHWYAAAPLAPGNLARMAAKARSVLQEKYIAAALDDAGAAFYDIKSAPRLSDKIRRRLERDLFDWKARRARRKSASRR